MTEEINGGFINGFNNTAANFTVRGWLVEKRNTIRQLNPSNLKVGDAENRKITLDSSHLHWLPKGEGKGHNFPTVHSYGYKSKMFGGLQVINYCLKKMAENEVISEALMMGTLFRQKSRQN